MLKRHLKDFDEENGCIQMKKYKSKDLFDFILLCQSPEYTPKTSDKLINIIQKYMIEIYDWDIILKLNTSTLNDSFIGSKVNTNRYLIQNRVNTVRVTICLF